MTTKAPLHILKPGPWSPQSPTDVRSANLSRFVFFYLLNEWAELDDRLGPWWLTSLWEFKIP